MLKVSQWHSGTGRNVIVACAFWLVLITVLHHWCNGGATVEGGLRVGFLPITCHLICPVAWNHLSGTPLSFEAVKFGSWPEMIEAFRSGNLDMTFILAPIALALHSQHVPLKLMLLGHRDGTALVLRADPALLGVRDLIGRTVAVPIRFSMQHLALRRLCEREGIAISQLNLVELPPPDMPYALAAGAIDAYIVGEPFAAQAELAGSGRILVHMKDDWPGFISSVVIVRGEVFEQRREEVAALLRAFSREAQWIEAHREEAARLAAPIYGLPEELLRYVLTTPPDRVTYRGLLPDATEMASIGVLMTQAGLLKEVPGLEGFIDRTWSDDAGDPL